MVFKQLCTFSKTYQRKVWEEEAVYRLANNSDIVERAPESSCQNPGVDAAYGLPLRAKYLSQVLGQFGVADS